MGYRASIRLQVSLAVLSIGLGAQFDAHSDDAPEAPTTDEQVDPASVIPGRTISDAEAKKIVEELRSRVYSPFEQITSLICEFEPCFVDTTAVWRAHEEERGYVGWWTEGLKVGFFEGTEFMPCLRDRGLSRARKGILYYQKQGTERPFPKSFTNVLLYDEDGKRIETHPDIGPMIGGSLLHRLNVFGQVPFWIVDLDERWQWEWRLDTPASGPQTIYRITRAATTSSGTEGSTQQRMSWNMSAVVFDGTGERVPLRAFTEWYDPQRESWTPQNAEEFGKLGDSGKVGIVRLGQEPHVVENAWREVGGFWVVERAKGVRPDFEFKEERKMVPWQIFFSNFQPNAPIPEGLLNWPPARTVKLDLISPEASIKTILDCLRSGRVDLLAHCSISPPEKPDPDGSDTPGLRYFFDEFEHMRKGLDIAEVRQAENAWIYTITIPQPQTSRLRTRDIKLVDVNGEWRMDVDLGYLHLAFWD